MKVNLYPDHLESSEEETRQEFKVKKVPVSAMAVTEKDVSSSHYTAEDGAGEDYKGCAGLENQSDLVFCSRD